jgi:hypothetical protein
MTLKVFVNAVPARANAIFRPHASPSLPRKSSTSHVFYEIVPQAGRPGAPFRPASARWSSRSAG